MWGSSSTGQHGFYGNQGVASISNAPGARHSATGWRDNDGNLWMFGSNGYGESSYG
jgi:hypothetical protein